MISQYYKDFRVRDYMNNDDLENQISNNVIDCSLGTNPFIDEKVLKEHILNCSYEINKYPCVQYEILKEELIKFWGEYLQKNVTKDNIAFGAGTMGILRNISEFLIQEKTKVLGCAPQFPRFISEVELKKVYMNITV